MSSCTKVLLALLMIAVVLKPVTSFAADAFEAGDDWLKWRSETRLAYVSAYVRGRGRGFRDGCVVGQGLYSAGESSGLPGEKCIAKIPPYSKLLEDYVATITEYYHSYPSDRDVPIFKVLESLSDTRSLSIQQMHTYLPGTERKRE
jgi:hypothetical protein